MKSVAINLDCIERGLSFFLSYSLQGPAANILSAVNNELH